MSFAHSNILTRCFEKLKEAAPRARGWDASKPDSDSINVLHGWTMVNGLNQALGILRGNQATYAKYITTLGQLRRTGNA